jgi:hypothetical protein
MHTRNGSTYARLTVLLLSSLLALGAEPSSSNKAKLPKALSDGSHPTTVERRLESTIVLPSLPKKMLVYRPEQSGNSPQSATNLAAKLLQATGPIQAKRTLYMAIGTLDGIPFRLEVDRATGSFTLENQDFYNPETAIRTTGNFPDAEEAKRIATEVLTKHKLMPEDAYLRGVADNTHGADVISVSYGRRVDGVECWGAGSQIIVNVGRGGAIARIRKAWPTLTPVAEYDLVKPEAAIQKLKDGEGVLYHGQKGKVVGMKLVYYASPTAQEYLQPCYFVDCQEMDNGKKFYGVIEAVQSE